MGKRLWDYKQKKTVKIVNLKIVNLKEGENSLAICCGVGEEGQWMMGRGSAKEAAFYLTPKEVRFLGGGAKVSTHKDKV